LRKDYLLDRWVIIATERGKRPNDFRRDKAEAKEDRLCFFCPGNEHTTPPEIGRTGTKKHWKMRWFKNKFAAVGNQDFYSQSTDGLLECKSANGIHEILVEMPEHGKQLSDLSVKQLAEVFHRYRDRIQILGKEKGVKYVAVFKNEGKEAGASLSHSHSQIVAYNEIPRYIRQEQSASDAYRKKKGRCVFCDIIKKERKSERLAAENKSFMAICPFASRYPMECWILPKNHRKDLRSLKETEFDDLASILKKILTKLRRIEAPYNFFIHYASNRKDLHLHIEIIPRLANVAGFEYCTGTTINTMAPEKAAEYYRGKR